MHEKIEIPETTTVRRQGRPPKPAGEQTTETPEYSALSHIKQRCLNPKNKQWHRYGGRGIKICKHLMDYKNFIAVAGKKPDPQLQIDRKNNDGHYSCGSCEECLREGWPLNIRWVKPEVNANNTCRTKLITYNGETLSINQWARRGKMSPSMMWRRLTRGESLATALVRGENGERRGFRRPQSMYLWDGKRMGAAQWARELGVGRTPREYAQFNRRLKSGWDPVKASQNLLPKGKQTVRFVNVRKKPGALFAK